jgi:hypothetical protein
VLVHDPPRCGRWLPELRSASKNRGAGAESIPAGEAVADDEEGADEGRGVEVHPKAVVARREVAHGLLAACYPIGGGHGIGSRMTRWRGAAGDGCSRCSRERRRWWCASPGPRWMEVTWPRLSKQPQWHSSPAMVGGSTSDSGVGLERALGSRAPAGSRGSHRWARCGRTTHANSSAASFAMAERALRCRVTRGGGQKRAWRARWSGRALRPSRALHTAQEGGQGAWRQGRSFTRAWSPRPGHASSIRAKARIVGGQ